jgi:RHS repeat-associated protein
VDANGNQRVYTYNSDSTLIEVKDPSSTLVQSWTQNFNAEGRGTGTMNANYQTDYITYGDPANPSKPTQITDKDSQSFVYTYDTHGNMTSSTDPRGVLTTYTWNYTNFSLGRLVEVQEGTKPSITMTYYEPSGLLHTVTYLSPTGTGTVTNTYTYDSLGNVLTVTGPGNNATSTVTTTYNYTTDGAYSQSAAIGQPLTITDNLGYTTHYRYDAMGRVTDLADALGNAGTITYNIAGQVLDATGPATGQTGSGHGYSQNVYPYVGGPIAQTRQFDESGTKIRETTYTYGAEGETLSVVGGTEPVSNIYDALYRIKTLVDGNSNITTYSYDNVGNMSQISYPGGDTVQFPYHDAVGRATQRIDGRGIVTNYTYGYYGNSAGALTYIDYPANYTRNVSLAYDSYGRVTNRTDGTGSQDYTYDDLDQLLSVTTTYNGLSPQTISYGYYANGSRANMSTPAGTFSYAYDAAGRPASITNPFSETTSWAYANNNWLTSQTLANGVVTTNTFNALGQATTIENKLGSTTLSAFGGMTHDGTGNRVSITASVPSASLLSGTTTYTYDTKSQLTGESSTRNSGYSNGFGYDTAGNPTTFKGIGKTYNSKNQLTSGTNYVYDGNGNPTTYNGTTLTFDEENKATTFGTALTAEYTSARLRAWKENSSSIRTYFLYDGVVPIVELDVSGNVSATNTFGTNGLVSRRTAGTGNSVFYTFDERGNTVQRLNSSGTILTSHISDAFGTTVSSAATGDPYDGYGAKYGYYTDHETGFVLCTFRYYDPSNGRWITRDPIGYSGGINLYGYTTNNPVTGIDWLGLCVPPISSPTTPHGQAELAEIAAEAGEAIPKPVFPQPTAAKLAKLGMTHIGQKIIGWGAAAEGARNLMKNLSATDLNRMMQNGLTADYALKLSNFYYQFYRYMQQQNINNPNLWTPYERYRLMYLIYWRLQYLEKMQNLGGK